MIFKPTRIIADFFEEKGLNFSLEEATSRNGNMSALHCPMPIVGAPTFMCSFINESDESDVAIRVYGLLNNTPAGKQAKMKETCNLLNRKCRFVKFYMNPDDGDVHAEYDLPPFMDDNFIADACFSIYMLLTNTLRKHYRTLANVMYSEEEDHPAPSRSRPGFLKEILSHLKASDHLDEDDYLISCDPHTEDSDFSDWALLLHERLNRDDEDASME